MSAIIKRSLTLVLVPRAVFWHHGVNKFLLFLLRQLLNSLREQACSSVEKEAAAAATSFTHTHYFNFLHSLTNSGARDDKRLGVKRLALCCRLRHRLVKLLFFNLTKISRNVVIECLLNVKKNFSFIFSSLCCCDSLPCRRREFWCVLLSAFLLGERDACFFNQCASLDNGVSDRQ